VIWFLNQVRSLADHDYTKAQTTSLNTKNTYIFLCESQKKNLKPPPTKHSNKLKWVFFLLFYPLHFSFFNHANILPFMLFEFSFCFQWLLFFFFLKVSKFSFLTWKHRRKSMFRGVQLWFFVLNLCELF